MRSPVRMRRAVALLLLSHSTSVHSFLTANNEWVAPSKDQSMEDIDGRITNGKMPQDKALTRIKLDGESLVTVSSTTSPGPLASGPDNLAAVMSVRTAVPTTTATFLPLEAWCLTHLDQWYHQSQKLKCPFLRRRYGDILDNVEKVMKHTVIRRQCWPLMGPPQAWRPAGANKKLWWVKYKGLSLDELRTFVWRDWKPETGKGYYVTGKLTTACYRDDCLFSGPDPDMPIQGLRKYVGVAAHLFDADQSRATLRSLEIVGDTLVADWQLQGILRLPWRPHLPTFDGTTVYHVDDDGLIERHEEFWEISVAHAFCHTLFPDIAKRIWNDESPDDTNDH